jgi:hypothetical protein
MLELSKTQISKIQSELNFFKSKGFKLTEEIKNRYVGDGYQNVYTLTKDAIEVNCYFTLLYSNRVSSYYQCWDLNSSSFFNSGTKKFKEFSKDFE